MEALRRATEARDADAVVALLAPDVVVRSPITTRIRFEGVDQVGDLLRRFFELVDDVRFYATVGEGESTQAVFWRGRIGRLTLEEANLFRLDDAGRIREMTVFMRPVPGLLALAAALGSSLARRRGPLAALATRAMLGAVAVVYRSGEPAGLALAGAGVRVPPGER